MFGFVAVVVHMAFFFVIARWGKKSGPGVNGRVLPSVIERFQV